MNTFNNLPIYELTLGDELDGVSLISIVTSPAIESNFLAFSDEKKKYTFSDNEKHILFGAALIPDLPIYRVGQNGEDYYVLFGKDTIEKIAQRFFKEGNQSNISLFHEMPVEDCFIFESFITDPERGIAPKDLDLPTGSWVVGLKVENDEVWDLVKDTDLLRGFSVECYMTPVRMSKEEKPEQVEDQKKIDFIDNLLEGKF